MKAKKYKFKSANEQIKFIAKHCSKDNWNKEGSNAVSNKTIKATKDFFTHESRI